MASGHTEIDRVGEIRRQMRLIRRDLGGQVGEVVESARQLTDWRQYVAAYPWVTFGVAFGLGYLLVPRPSKPATPIIVNPIPETAYSHRKKMDKVEEKAVKTSIIGTALTLASGYAVKAATSYATSLGRSYLEKWLRDQHILGGGPTPRYPEPYKPNDSVRR